MQLAALRADLDSYPKRIREADTKLNSARAALAAAKEAHTNSLKERKKFELDVDQWNVSPKLTNSGNPVERRYKPDVLRAFEGTDRAIFKFVVCEAADLHPSSLNTLRDPRRVGICQKSR